MTRKAAFALLVLPVVAPSIRRRVRRSWPQRFLISFNVVVVMACLLATAGGLALVRQKLANVQVVSLGVSLAPGVADDAPRNVLIIGTDNADGLDKSDPIHEQRPRGELLADVVMIVRLEPKENRASILSIPA